MKKIVSALIVIVLIITSFFAGSYVKEKEYLSERYNRCNTFISFAIDKVENGDLTDSDTIEALISNIYAAYEFCDDPISKNQLHDLWNYMIFEYDNTQSGKDILSVELKSISDAIKSRN